MEPQLKVLDTRHPPISTSYSQLFDTAIMAISLFSKLAACLAVLSFPQISYSLGATDTITWGGDNSRAGYETNHNLDPQTVASADFGNIWKTKLPGNFQNLAAEQVLSQPLVYTTSDGTSKQDLHVYDSCSLRCRSVTGYTTVTSETIHKLLATRVH